MKTLSEQAVSIGAPSEFWISQWKLGSNESPVIRRAALDDVQNQLSTRKKRGKKQVKGDSSKVAPAASKSSEVKSAPQESKKRALPQEEQVSRPAKKQNTDTLSSTPSSSAPLQRPRHAMIPPFLLNQNRANFPFFLAPSSYGPKFVPFYAEEAPMYNHQMGLPVFYSGKYGPVYRQPAYNFVAPEDLSSSDIRSSPTDFQSSPADFNDMQQPSPYVEQSPTDFQNSPPIHSPVELQFSPNEFSDEMPPFEHAFDLGNTLSNNETFDFWNGSF